VEQAEATLARHGVVGVEVGTIQSLDKPGDNPRLLIVDEAHTVALATDWAAKIRALRAEYVIGLTATPVRGDGRGFENAFQHLVLGPTVKDLEAQGHLVPAEYYGPDTILRSGKIAMEPVEAYRSYFEGGGAILFAPNLKAAAAFAERFVKADIPADVIEGELSKKKRAAMIDAFREGRLKILCNVAILTEGFDLPELEGIIVARPVGHMGLYTQMIGRGVRAFPGKVRGLVVDLQGNFHIHGKHDEEMVYSLEGRGMQAASKIQAPAYCLTCGLALDDKQQAVCTFCAAERPELVVPRSMAKQIMRWEKFEKIADPRRVRMLAMWLQQARAKGWKPGAPFAKYKGMFGHNPPPHVVLEAKKAVR
jgi:superfamily II DNA or RNA helicase